VGPLYAACVPRRIDVELTSAKEDGSFTWRAAGAKQPKGVVEGSLLYGGAKVGDVVRAEADFDIEGITIVSVVPPPHATVRAEPTRIDIVGTGRDEPGVTSSAPARDRGPRRDDDHRDRRDGERRGARPDRGAPRGDRREGSGGPRDGERGDRRGPRPERTERPDRPGRPERSDRPERPARPERGSRPERAPSADRPGRAPGGPGGERARPKRLSPGNAHRDAYLATLVPEQRVVAELILRGGIPAVRAAVAQQNQNRPEGAPAIDADPLVSLAEEMLPGARQAEWRDRADAAKAALDEVGLRDLRAIVTAGDASARDDEAKELAAELRQGLERRTTADREAWLAEMSTCLADGKVVRALRLSSRPPDPSTKVPGDVLEQLRVAAGEALGPATPQDRWAALLEAVIASPVRRTVEPQGLPPQAGPALQLAARQASGRIPALATLLGVALPPPPGLRAPSGRGGRATPPPPPRPTAPPAPSAVHVVESAPGSGAAATAPATLGAEPVAVPVDEAPGVPPPAEPVAVPVDEAPAALALDEPEVASDGAPERVDGDVGGHVAGDVDAVLSTPADEPAAETTPAA